MTNKLFTVASLILLSMSFSCSNKEIPSEEKQVKDAAQELIDKNKDFNKIKASSDELNLKVETQEGNSIYTINRFELNKASFNMYYEKDGSNIDVNAYSSYGNLNGDFTVFESQINRLNKETVFEKITSIKLDEDIMLKDNNLYAHVSNDVLDLIDIENNHDQGGLDLTLNNISGFANDIATSYLGEDFINKNQNNQVISQIKGLNPNEILIDFLDENKPYSPYLDYQVVDPNSYKISLELDKNNINTLIGYYAGDNTHTVSNALTFDNSTKLKLDVNFSKDIVDSIDANIDLTFTYVAKLFKTNIKLDTTIDFANDFDAQPSLDLTKEFKTFEDLGIDAQQIVKDQIDTYLPFIDMIGDILKEV